MSTLFTKICGITRLEDAEYALACGASAVGFVFWPGSPRAIDPDRARVIASAVPSALTCGVFVNQSREEVMQIAAAVPLDAIQLHGDEPVDYADSLERPVLKAVTLDGAAEQLIDTWPDRVLILLDAHDPERRGGTGRTVDWRRASAIAQRRPIVLAGGLRPGNAADAIACVRPFGIDVSSGVEARPGVKDRARLKALFEAIDAAASARPDAPGGPSTSGAGAEDRWLRACGWGVPREGRRA